MKKVSLGSDNKKSGFEPLDLCLDKRKNTALGGARPDWLRAPNEVRTYFMETEEYIYMPQLTHYN